MKKYMLLVVFAGVGYSSLHAAVKIVELPKAGKNVVTAGGSFIGAAATEVPKIQEEIKKLRTEIDALSKSTKPENEVVAAYFQFQNNFLEIAERANKISDKGSAFGVAIADLVEVIDQEKGKKAQVVMGQIAQVTKDFKKILDEFKKVLPKIQKAIAAETGESAELEIEEVTTGATTPGWSGIPGGVAVPLSGGFAGV